MALDSFIDQHIHMTDREFNIFMAIMCIIAVFVFIALFFIKAGYGKFVSSSWGLSIPNKVAWVLMEAPVFFIMLFFWYKAPESRKYSPVCLVFLIFFEIHYFQRSFIFPLLLKGKSRMPIIIMLMGIVFNFCNGTMQGQWIFFVHPDGYYGNGTEWFANPKFIIGTIIFFTGMFINWHSDHVIRHLRKPGDNKHYLPHRGLYKYVTSANYFGEIVEWTGFAILTWSPSGAVFVWWTIANLFPRAVAIYKHYKAEFGAPVNKKKIIIPFIL
jgi:3-oxo-5-alpha-steroid 4-dehydrogenase 1